MGVRKGTDNFSEYRDAKVEANRRLIAHELEKQRKRKIPYPNLRILIADIADKTKIHRTTLNRNATYKKLILTHLAAQRGGGVAISDDEASPELLRKKLFDARLEIRTLLNRVRVLTAALERKGDAKVMAGGGSAPVGRATPDWYMAFSDTAMLLVQLIDRLGEYGGMVTFDVEKAQIIDHSASSDSRIVAGPERAKPFAEFYKTLKLQEKPAKGLRNGKS